MTFITIVKGNTFPAESDVYVDLAGTFRGNVLNATIVETDTLSVSGVSEFSDRIEFINAISIGNQNTQSSGSGSIAIGDGTVATGDNSVAIGGGASTTSEDQISIGNPIPTSNIATASVWGQIFQDRSWDDGNIGFAKIDSDGNLIKDTYTTTSGITMSSSYRFNNSTTQADPGNGNFRMNNATPSSVTEIFVSSTNNNSNDWDNILNLVSSGDTIYIQQDDDSSRYVLLDVTANVDNTGWYSIAVTVSSSGTLFNNNGKCHIMIIFGGIGSSVSSFSAGTTGLTPNSPTTGDIVLTGTLAATNGGTGLTAIGTSDQLLGVNNAGSALEYKSDIDISGAATFGGLLTVGGNVIIQGNLYIGGNTVIVETDSIVVEDNSIIVNYGELGAGVTKGNAGIVVDRGSLDDYVILFDEAKQGTVIGNIGYEQMVATREDSPLDGGVAYWNDTLKRFDTDAGLNYDSVTNALTVDGNINANNLGLWVGTATSNLDMDCFSINNVDQLHVGNVYGKSPINVHDTLYIRDTSTGGNITFEGGIIIGDSATIASSSAIAIGGAANATVGIDAITIGKNSEASASKAISIGWDAKAYDSSASGYIEGGAIAIGGESRAAALGSICIGTTWYGSPPEALGRYSIAIGFQATNVEYGTVAIGQNSHAEGEYSVAVGHGSSAIGRNCVAIGDANTASDANRSVAIGDEARIGTNVSKSVSIGSSSTSYSGNSTVTLGHYSLTNGEYAISIGCNSRSLGQSSIAIGGNLLISRAEASDTNAIAIGNDVRSSSMNSIGIGNDITSSGTNGIAMGSGAVNNRESSIALGTNSRTTGYGYLALATNAIAVGNGATVQDQRSIAIGQTATVIPSGGYSARAYSSIAMGYNSSVSKNNSIAIGSNSEANGSGSISLGNNAYTNASDAISIGINSSSSSSGSVAIGQGVTANQTGGMFMKHRGPGSYTVNNAGFISGTNELVEVTSSRRFKRNILDMSEEEINTKFDQLRAVTYEAKPGCGDDRVHIGLIAEEVEEIFPELVTYNQEGQVTGLMFDRMVAPLIKEVQRLRKKEREFELRLAILETKI
jgi:trimeric autotransporter adhesin